jgi:mono/diheme cytochrome c family protein
MNQQIYKAHSVASALCWAAFILTFGVESTSAQVATDAFDGEWRYRVSCATCHGVRGEGITAFGPPLSDNAFVAGAPAASIIAVVTQGRYARSKAYPEYPGMPAFYYLRAGEMQALVNYLKAALQK